MILAAGPGTTAMVEISAVARTGAMFMEVTR